MFARVLVPLDGSPRAERSLPVASSIARSVDGEVLLVRIVGEEAVTTAARRQPRAGAAAAVLDNSTATQEVDEAVAAAYVREVGHRLERDGIRYNTDVVTGHAASDIVGSARRHKVDLIVICSHGWTGLTQWALGGTAEKIIRGGEVSVLVLHEGGPLPLDRTRTSDDELRVLVPFDGSDAARGVIPQAVPLTAALAGTRRIELHLFQVVNVAYPGNPHGARPEIGASGAARAVRAARVALSETESRLNLELGEHWNVRVTSSLTAQVDVAAAIIGMAETGQPDASPLHHGLHHHERGFDLIAMPAIADTQPAHIAHGGALGSIPGRIIYGTKLPTFAVRPPVA